MRKTVTIENTKDLNCIKEDMLTGFFVDWPNPPNSATHLKILSDSYCSFIAIDKDTNRIVGFINAISDGVLSAYIPLLEVLPEYQGLGIGSELIKCILEELSDLYMIDVCHDEELSAYYARFGAHSGNASLFRNYSAQSGKGCCPRKL